MIGRRIEPGPGQESVWDYPRPPRVEPVKKQVRVIFNGEVIADTRNAKRILETSHPPTFYIPPEDLKKEAFKKASGSSFCEWKGSASYFDIVVGDKREAKAAWTYPNPTAGFESIKDHISLYAGRVDACYVGDEKVEPQPGGFYGGWITKEIVGPFKGGPGTWGW
eukprot:TRINITY_DN9829_c0_g1_i8.p1 TRINITY_DN9829_c0_g1~~TRINITY_DN9829_c0_g1_i8.p1  ORF type:complete len:165 (+),score=32.35 TRINITY_DN9829_c0_g1_i8:111-605(+)